MWPYLAEQLTYAWAYVQLLYAIYVRPFLKPEKPEDHHGKQR